MPELHDKNFCLLSPLFCALVVEDLRENIQFKVFLIQHDGHFIKQQKTVKQGAVLQSDQNPTFQTNSVTSNCIGVGLAIKVIFKAFCKYYPFNSPKPKEIY